MLRMTETAKITAASVDEIRYLEKKGFIKSIKTRLKQRQVRQFTEEDIRTAELIIKYRRQGFTWDTAFQKARQEIERPALF
ncbi:MAG: MerR family transcriptional regulator [Dehalococcoidales bacterium]|nr:MerR family transcriptional regulator [Dehalococcoidales bacterium]